MDTEISSASTRNMAIFGDSYNADSDPGPSSGPSTDIGPGSRSTALPSSVTDDKASEISATTSKSNNADSAGSTTASSSTAKKPVTRRRTKTGCMTCRKRRIKCDEGRPGCNNCQKSRKICEGYGPRLYFKPPLTDGAGALLFGPGFMPASGHRAHHRSHYHQATSPLAILAPRPDSSQNAYVQYPLPMADMSFEARAQAMIQARDQSFLQQMHLQQQQQQHEQHFAQQHTHHHTMQLPLQHPPHHHHHVMPGQQHPLPSPPLIMERIIPHGPASATAAPGPAGAPRDIDISNIPADIAMNFQFDPHLTAAGLMDLDIGISDDLVAEALESQFQSIQSQSLDSSVSLRQQQEHQHQPQSQLPPQVQVQDQPPTQPLHGVTNEPVLDISPSRTSEQLVTPSNPVTTRVIDLEEQESSPLPSAEDRQAVPAQENNFFYMDNADEAAGFSDDEQDPHHEADEALVAQHTVAWQQNVAYQMAHTRGGFNMPALATQIRSFSFYANDENVLASYTPSPHNSPLNDPNTASVFFHFVNITAFAMSLYERHPLDHARFVAEVEAINLARQAPPGHNIWSHTLPIISFNHPALLQAILALASLQIANLRQIPPTAALRHYHLALRRIARNVKSANRRGTAATLAAMLVLAYFEVWQSDHNKWCNHLFGASILFSELKLPELTRRILPSKRRRWLEKTTKQAAEQEAQREAQDPFNPFYSLDDQSQEIEPDLDELDCEFLGYMTGTHIEPEEFGLGPIKIEKQPNEPTERDIENYEHQRDLFYWFLRMNIYQSMLGGTKLFMGTEVFRQCPPRSAMGNAKAIYGTFDHLLLLLSQVRLFANKDLPRKIRASKMNKSGPSPPPMFNGMMPRDMKVEAPMGFSPQTADSPENETSEEMDFDEETEAANKEWNAIIHAFELFEAHLGPDFAPLAPEFTDRRDSPFGPTLQYRTFSVAGIWMNYYMGIIHIHRAHPSMPPASMMAAGRAARQTAEYARNLGRIAAGLSDDTTRVSEITALLGAAFIESCFCLFVAGIQYQDQEQRAWLVIRMYETARLTGWGSARQIAEGCEAAWAKAAHMNHGPRFIKPDISSFQNLSVGSRMDVWNNPRRLDRRFEELEDEKLVLVQSERAHFALGLLEVEEDMSRLQLKDTMQ
ncbi:uncharacterized protein BROUX77_008037 [Berkeleyomyces rouxiae]|uniref:uncharacterized protein n=1 Tax=Berkeleyomyces rouxiae TaxID=2035830 RepID=UPI003B7E963F